jgi:sec-independent protein translocase protein TatA
MSNFKGWEILIILALLLILFGAKRMPDAARGLGRSLRIFKAETKGLRDDDKDRDEGDASQRSDLTDSTPAPRTPELEAPAQPREPVAPRPVEHETRER